MSAFASEVKACCCEIAVSDAIMRQSIFMQRFFDEILLSADDSEFRVQMGPISLSAREKETAL